MKLKKKSKILVVDDIADNIEIVREILNSRGYEVHTAESGHKAIKKASNTEYDLIILDVMMPEIDGYEVCRQLKKNTKTKEIPVIFLTAKTYINDMVKGFKAGAVDYITNPFRSEEITIRVHTHIELKKTKDSLKEEVKKEKKLSAELKEALAKVKTLSGLLPICCYCFKIKDTEGYWRRVDEYIRKHADVEFSHGICDECSKKVFKELDDMIKDEKSNKKNKKKN